MNEGNLTIQNKESCTGSLYVNVTTDVYAFGISAAKNLTIKSGTVEVTADAGGSSGAVGIGVGDDLTISEGTVNASADSEHAYAYGIFSDAGGMSITDGTVKASAVGNVSNGIYANLSGVSIGGGTVTADALGNASTYGIYTNTSALTISGTAQVTADAESAAGDALGIFAKSGNLTISDSAQVTADADSAADNALGIFAVGDITISGNTVNAYAEVNAPAVGPTYADGIYALGDLQISGGTVNASVPAESGTALATGIFAVGDLTISGGNVTADALGDDSTGVYAVGNTIIDGGKTLAIGKTQAVNTTDGTFSVAPHLAGNVSASIEGTNLISILPAEGVMNASYKYAVIEQADVLFNVTFDSRGGTSIPVLKVADGNIFAKPADPTRSSYSFAGWYNDSALTDAWNFETDCVTNDTTLYAKWTYNGGGGGGYAPASTAYTVTFDANGGEGSMSPQTFISGKEMALSANTFTREGFVFKGWAESADGDAVYVDGETILVKKSQTLYAVWTELNPTVTPTAEPVPTGPAPTEPGKSPAPVLGLVLGGLAAAAVLRRK